MLIQHLLLPHVCHGDAAPTGQWRGAIRLEGEMSPQIGTGEGGSPQLRSNGHGGDVQGERRTARWCGRAALQPAGTTVRKQGDRFMATGGDATNDLERRNPRSASSARREGSIRCEASMRRAQAVHAGARPRRPQRHRIRRLRAVRLAAALLVLAEWRRPLSSSWRVDETYIKVRGKWAYLYRAVDKFCDTIDFYLSSTRNTAAAKRFLGKALRESREWGLPEVVNTGKAPPHVPSVLHGLHNTVRLVPSRSRPSRSGCTTKGKCPAPRWHMA